MRAESAGDTADTLSCQCLSVRAGSAGDSADTLSCQCLFVNVCFS